MDAALIGIPYIDGGRDLTGVDCFGLYRLWHESNTGIDIPEYSYMMSEIANNVPETIINATLEARWLEITLGSELPGDLILFNILGEMQHVGVVLGGGKMLHTLRGRNSVIENYLKAIGWRHRIQGVYRYVG